MNPGKPFHLLELLDLFNGKTDPLFSLFSLAGPVQTFDKRFGHIYPGDLFSHILRHACRFHGSYTGKNVCFLSQSHIHSPFHKVPEPFHVIDTLGLDKISSRIYFVGKPVNPELIRICKRVAGRADEKFGRNINIFAVHKRALIPHHLD